MPSFDRALLVTYLRPQARRVITLGVILPVGIVLQLANPQIVAVFINDAQSGGSTHELLTVAAVFTAVVLLAQGLAVAESYVAEDIGWRSTNALRADLTRHVLALDGSFHSAFGAGELIERIDGDVSAIADFFSRFALQLVGSAVFLAGVLILLFLTDWRIGLVMIASSAVALAYLALGGKPVSRRAETSRQAAADLSGYIEERLEGMPDLKPNGAAGYVMARFHERLAARFQTMRKAAMAGALFNGTVGSIFAVGTGASLAVALVLHSSGILATGTIYVIFRYSTMLQVPVEQLSRQMNIFQQATGGIVRVRQLLHTTSKVRTDGRKVLPPGPLGLEFDNVTFSYGNEPVLTDLTFRLEAGEVLGLVGRTGAGKTTISRLLFRLHDPESGVIRVGGVPSSELELDALRAHVGFVPQDVQLFEGSIRDNLTMFDSTVSDARLAGVFDQLGLSGWLHQQVDGLDTMLGPGGRGLSAGEGQLVALARVFLKDPGLVVLDEASSRLDPATQSLIEVGVEKLLVNRTGIIIAHRLETVERADSILVLDHGRAVEYGRRSDLAADEGSRYRTLLRASGSETRS